jgi:hypothetical protein
VPLGVRASNGSTRAEPPLVKGTNGSGHECRGRCSALSSSAKPSRMDGAQRSQSHLDRSSLRAKSPSLIGPALNGAVGRVVWDRGANYSLGPDWAA